MLELKLFSSSSSRGGIIVVLTVFTSTILKNISVNISREKLKDLGVTCLDLSNFLNLLWARSNEASTVGSMGTFLFLRRRLLSIVITIIVRRSLNPREKNQSYVLKLGLLIFLNQKCSINII